MYYTLEVNSTTKTILQMAVRDSIQDPWQHFMSFTGIHTTGVYDAYASLSSDELTLYYSRRNALNNYEIWRASRDSVDQQFLNRVPVTELNSMAYTTTPFILPDGLSIFYAAGPDFYSLDLYMATRDSVNDLFGNIESLNINTPALEGGPFIYITSDLSALYFHSMEGIWMSTPIPEPATCLFFIAGGFLLIKKGESFKRAHLGSR